jgi:UDP-2,4-diacetamido-2,4,6-trideoxy-beta-L-altropyranose hydrolase
MTASQARELVLRADADHRIGIGHAMRALAIGEAWVSRGRPATWIVADAPEPIRRRARAAGIETRSIAEPGGSAFDAATLGSAIASPAAAAVIDGPSFDAAYLDRLAPVAGRVALIDDLGRLDRYPVGLVVNQNAHADPGAYPAGPRLLMGLDYVLLRPEFRTASPTPRLPRHAEHVLVMFGGADPAEMTGRTIRAILAPGAPVTVTAVIGPANRTATRIEEVAAASGDRVRIVRGVERMPDLMAAADLAVVSGGSTVWELARMGVPAIVIETAPAEVDLCRGLRTVGLFDTLGPASGLDDETIGAAVARRVEDVVWRTHMSNLGRSLVDGLGTDRLIVALDDLVTSSTVSLAANTATGRHP